MCSGVEFRSRVAVLFQPAGIHSFAVFSAYKAARHVFLKLGQRAAFDSSRFVRPVVLVLDIGTINSSKNLINVFVLHCILVIRLRFGLFKPPSERQHALFINRPPRPAFQFVQFKAALELVARLASWPDITNFMLELGVFILWFDVFEVQRFACHEARAVHTDLQVALPLSILIRRISQKPLVARLLTI